MRQSSHRTSSATHMHLPQLLQSTSGNQEPSPFKQVAPQRNFSTNLQPTNLGFDSIYLLINQDHVCKGARTETLCDSSEGHNCNLGWILYPLSAKRAQGNGAHHLLQFLAHYSHWKEGDSPSAEGAEHVPIHDEGGTMWELKPHGMKTGTCWK